jgi:hypothetical protein
MKRKKKKKKYVSLSLLSSLREIARGKVVKENVRGRWLCTYVDRYVCVRG